MKESYSHFKSGEKREQRKLQGIVDTETKKDPFGESLPNIFEPNKPKLSSVAMEIDRVADAYQEISERRIEEMESRIDEIKQELDSIDALLDNPRSIDEKFPKEKGSENIQTIADILKNSQSGESENEYGVSTTLIQQSQERDLLLKKKENFIRELKERKEKLQKEYNDLSDTVDIDADIHLN